MTLKVDGRNYFAALWFIAPDAGGADVLAALYLEPGKPHFWRFQMRYRGYRDAVAWGSADEKSWWTAQVPGPEASALRAARKILDTIASETGSAKHEILTRTKDAKKIMAALEREPWAHVRREDKP